MENKPPIGLEPKFLINEQREACDIHRGRNICNAILRFLDAGWVWPADWTSELISIQESMNKRRADDNFKDGTVKD